MKLLDLFCGAGGCAEGYHRAGFEVVGVDHEPQKHYPFEFHQADAFAYCLDHADEFDVIHGSPPCQAYSVAAALHRNAGRNYPDLVGATRDAMQQTGRPWIIENVPGAPLQSPIVLCGLMFGLHVFRHRIFESSEFILEPSHQSHTGKRIGHGYYSVAGGSGRWKSWGRSGEGIMKGTIAECSDAMGIDWMTRKELVQAIPPAYTEYIGRQLIRAINTPKSAPDGRLV